MLKLEKFVKLMMLTQSDSDGEALNALRRANKLLKEAGQSWQEFIEGTRTARTWSEYADPEPDLELETMLRVCVANVHGAAREFILSLETQYKLRGDLSPKQRLALRKFYHNCK